MSTPHVHIFFRTWTQICLNTWVVASGRKMCVTTKNPTSPLWPMDQRLKQHAVKQHWGRTNTKKKNLLRWTHVFCLPGIEESHHLPDAVLTDDGLRGLAQVSSLLFKFPPHLWNRAHGHHKAAAVGEKKKHTGHGTNLRPLWWVTCSSPGDPWYLFSERHRFPSIVKHLWD